MLRIRGGSRRKYVPRNRERSEKGNLNQLLMEFEDAPTDLLKGSNRKEELPTSSQSFENELQPVRTNIERGIRSRPRTHSEDIPPQETRIGTTDSKNRSQREFMSTRAARESRNEMDNSKQIQEECKAQIEEIKKLHKRELEVVQTTAAKYLSEINALKKKLTASEENPKDELRERAERAENANQDLHYKFERMQEQISDLEEELRTTRANESEKQSLLKQKIDAYEKTADFTTKELQKTQVEREELKSKLLETQSQILDLKEIHDEQLKALQDSTKNTILALQEELDAAIKSIEDKENLAKESKDQIARMNPQLENLQNQLVSEKQKALDAVYESQENLAETKEQLIRVQKYLEDSRNETDSLRKRLSERDEEILEIKREMRKQDRELLKTVMNQDSAGFASKRIIDSKSKELEKSHRENSRLLEKIIQLEKNLDLSKRNVEDAKTEMARRQVINKDDGLVEVDRLQMMVLDLKTSQADLLEKLDDSQHAMNVMKRELHKLQINNNNFEKEG